MYLKIVSSDPSNLTREIVICTACYKHFQMIHKDIQSGKANTCISSISQTQRNTDIDSRLHDVCSQQNNIYKRRASATTSDFEYFEYVVCIFSRYVGGADEAMLLPKLYKDFTQEVYTHIASFSSVNFSESDIPSSRLLLSCSFTF